VQLKVTGERLDPFLDAVADNQDHEAALLQPPLHAVFKLRSIKFAPIPYEVP